MPESTIIRTKRDAQVMLFDLGAVHTYTVSREAGDFQLDVPGEEYLLLLDRGKINDIPDLRVTDDQPMTWGFSAHLRDIGDTDASPTYATLSDICFRYRGKYVDTTWISTMYGYSDAFTLGVSYAVDGSAFGEADKTLTIPHNKVRGSFQEGDSSTFSVAGTGYATSPTLT